MALQNVQRIQIELDGSAPFEYVVAKAGEKESRIVEVTLLENKKEFTVPAGTTAKIKYYKPDGKFVLNNATINGNVITVTYTEQMLAVSGTGRGEIVLYNGTAVLRSATYYTKITPTVYKENGLISDNEFLDMTESIIAMNKQIDKAINATKSAEQAATDANTAATAANSAAKAGNAAATAGNNAAKAAQRKMRQRQQEQPTVQQMQPTKPLQPPTMRRKQEMQQPQPGTAQLRQRMMQQRRQMKPKPIQ